MKGGTMRQRDTLVGLTLLAALFGLTAARSATPSVGARFAPSGASPVLGAIQVPDAGLGAVDVATRHIFITGQASYKKGATGTASTLDIQTGTLVRTVNMGCAPYAIAASQRTERVFVVNSYLKSCNRAIGTVSMLDAHNGHLLSTVNVGDIPIAGAVDERIGRVYILNAVTPLPAHPGSTVLGGVSVLDARSGRVLTTISLGTHNYPLVFTPNTLAVDTRRGRGFALIANDVVTARAMGSTPAQFTVTTTVILFDTQRDRVLRTLAVNADHSTGVVVDERTGHAFVTGSNCGVPVDTAAQRPCISMIDTGTGRVLRTVTGLGGPLVVDTRHGRVFVADHGGVAALDTRTGRVVLRRGSVVPRNHEAILLGIDGRNGRLLETYIVPDRNGHPVGPGNVYVLDGRDGAILHTVSIASGISTAATVDEHTGRAFITTGPKTMTVLDMTR